MIKLKKPILVTDSLKTSVKLNIIRTIKINSYIQAWIILLLENIGAPLLTVDLLFLKQDKV